VHIRKIVKINEEKCNGCGLCIPKCKEGALQIVDGKARLVHDRYCDGLGACIGECPRDAIEIVEREAEDFDAQAAWRLQHAACSASAVPPSVARDAPEPVATRKETPTCAQWPVQLRLVPVHASFLNNADLLLTADCVPIVFTSFHNLLLAGRKVLVACPKFDDISADIEKLAAILQQNNIRSMTVAHMEVPCCLGLVAAARRAVELSRKSLPFTEVTISVSGEILTELREAEYGMPHCAALTHATIGSRQTECKSSSGDIRDAD
jgi:Pyruvate/2-oxoacid:ferredoxin oxidoreductase delta subunit